MSDTDTQLIVGAITNLREDISSHHKENKERLERSDARQDKLETTLGDLADNMSTLATSMARLEEVQERMEKDNERQREIDKIQDIKLEKLLESWHEADKKLSALTEVPDEIKINRHGLKDLENRVNALNLFQDGQVKQIAKLDETLTSSISVIKQDVEELKKEQAKDTATLNSIQGWSKWFKEKILPAIILAGVPAAVMYWIMSQNA